MKTITLSSGKQIHVFDDLFTLTQRRWFKDFAQDCYLRPEGRSTTAWEHPGNFLLARFGPKDLENFKLLDAVELNPVFEILGRREIDRAWLLFSDLSTKIYYHTDVNLETKNAFSMLYYVNLEWKDYWGGETIFADENGEAEVCVTYKPGRVVLFDSTINHKAACISSDAPFRYTFNCVFR